MRVCFRVLAVAAVLMVAGSVARAQDFESIPATELRDQPQRYWARGFVVQDTLVAHAGEESRKIGDRKASPFRTEILGDCFVDHQLRDVLNSLELGKPYLFAGTVYQERRGLFSRDLRYTIVIKRITATMDDSAELARKLAAEAAARGPFAETFASMDRVLTAAQQDLLAYAASSNIAMEALFEASSPHAARVTQAIRQSLTRNEIDSKVPMVEFLARIMTGLLAARNGALAPEPEPVVEPAPEPVAAVETPESAEQEDAVAADEPVAELEPALVVERPIDPEPASAVSDEAADGALSPVVDELEAMDREAEAAAEKAVDEGEPAPVLPVISPVVAPEPDVVEEAVPVEETRVSAPDVVEPAVEEVPVVESTPETEAENERPAPARLPPARIDINAPLPLR